MMFNKYEVIQISFAEGEWEALPVKLVSHNIYQLGATPICDQEIAWGDVIAVSVNKQGHLIFQQLVKKAPYQTYSWLVSKTIQDSPELKKWCEQIIEIGGMWEKLLGGLLVVHIPLDSSFQAPAEFNQFIHDVKIETQ